MDDKTRETFWRAFAESPFIMMKLDGASGHAEPMTAHLDQDAHHAFWFFTTRNNRIGAGGPAMGQVVTKGHEVFACIGGALVEETDAAVRDKHWSNVVESWFPNGKSDPDVVMLRFEISGAEVWVQDMSIKGKLKMLAGRPISPQEAGEHAVGLV